MGISEKFPMTDNPLFTKCQNSVTGKNFVMYVAVPRNTGLQHRGQCNLHPYDYEILLDDYVFNDRIVDDILI